MDLNRETMKKLMLLITFTVLLLVGVQRMDVVLDVLSFIWSIIFPFALGAAIAFILNVPMHAIEKRIFEGNRLRNRTWSRKCARPVSLILSLLLVMGLIGIVIFVVVPELSTTVVSLGSSIEAFLPKAEEWLNEIFQDNAQVAAWLNGLELNWDKMLETGFNFFKMGAGSVLSSTVNAAKTIISAVTTFFVAIVFACYILLQKEKLGVQAGKLLRALLPEAWVHRWLHVCALSSRTFSNFITGQCLEAVILGMMFFVTMSVFRFPYALLVGVLIAFTALIPIFGAFIGCAIGAFLILMVNPVQALTFIILFFVLQQIEGNFIYPHVVGNSVGLPSIWVLAAVTIGGSLMGVVGMLIFIPAASVVYALLREWVYKRLGQKEREGK